MTIPKFRFYWSIGKVILDVTGILYDGDCIHVITCYDGTETGVMSIERSISIENGKLLKNLHLEDNHLTPRYEPKDFYSGDIVEFDDEVYRGDLESIYTTNRAVLDFDGFEWYLTKWWKTVEPLDSVAYCNIYEERDVSLREFLLRDCTVVGNIYENNELLEEKW